MHVIAARGTNVKPGYDILLPLVTQIKTTYAEATSESIDYPACDGKSSCGGIRYPESAKRGTVAVAKAVNGFYKKCPKAQLVLMGSSQGGQIIDNALCGGADPGPVSPASLGTTDAAVAIDPSAAKMVKAAILVGNPSFRSGPPYTVGSCRGKGVVARPEGSTCSNGDKVHSWCDAEDPVCCQGRDYAVHGAYVTKYKTQILDFVNSKLAG